MSKFSAVFFEKSSIKLEDKFSSRAVSVVDASNLVDGTSDGALDNRGDPFTPKRPKTSKNGGYPRLLGRSCTIMM